MKTAPVYSVLVFLECPDTFGWSGTFLNAPTPKMVDKAIAHENKRLLREIDALACRECAGDEIAAAEVDGEIDRLKNMLATFVKCRDVVRTLRSLHDDGERDVEFAGTVVASIKVESYDAYVQ